MKRHPLLAYFLLAFGICWTLWLPAFGVEGLPVVLFHHALGALGPITAAFVMTRIESGRTGVRDLLERMVLWRGRAAWVLVTLGGEGRRRRRRPPIRRAHHRTRSTSHI